LMYANYSPSANQLRGSENPPVGFSSHGAVTNLVAGWPIPKISVVNLVNEDNPW
jgi:hypothetical protein